MAYIGIGKHLPQIVVRMKRRIKIFAVYQVAVILGVVHKHEHILKHTIC